MSINVIIIILFSISLLIILSSTSIKELYEEKEISDVLPEISKIYYINLNRRADRKQEFLSNFSKTDIENRIERIEAVETPENGAVGCLMSHIKTLRQCLENNDDISFVCEDDLHIFSIKKMNNLIAYIMKNFKKWDVIMIGCGANLNLQKTVRSAFGCEIKKVSGAQTTSGYIIKKEYIPKLLQIYEDTYKKYSENLEWVYGSYESDQCWKPLQENDSWFSFYPRIGKQRASYSDIMNTSVNYESFTCSK